MDNVLYNNKYYNALESFGGNRRGEATFRACSHRGRQSGVDRIDVGLTEARE